MKNGMREEVVTGREMGPVGRVVQNEQAVALSAGTSLVSSMGQRGSNIF